MSEVKFIDSNKKMPLMTLPVRTSVLRLANGIVLLSPGSQLTKDQLQQAGEITDIVAPNLFHCAGIKLASEVFPQANVWGPIGARELKPHLPWTHILGKDEWPFEDELSHVVLGGAPSIQESVFIHKVSKTLYVADLFFNLQNASGLGARIILGLFGTYRRFALSRFFKRFIKDHNAFEASFKKILSHDFNCIVMAHGELLENAHQAARDAARERGLNI